MKFAKRPRDPAQLAKLMIDIASGDIEDKAPDIINPDKDPAAVSLGRRGGLKGGKALFAMYYNFVRIHKTLRMSPAMAAGVTKRLWEMSDVVDMLEAWENPRQSTPSGPVRLYGRL